MGRLELKLLNKLLRHRNKVISLRLHPETRAMRHQVAKRRLKRRKLVHLRLQKAVRDKGRKARPHLDRRPNKDSR